MTVAHFPKYAYLCTKFIQVSNGNGFVAIFMFKLIFLEENNIFRFKKNQMRFPLPTANAFFLYGQNHLINN